MTSTIIHEVRDKRPLIHHLTNQVVMNFTANGLLSFGGVPIMAKAVEESGEMASNADGVLINIGTIMRNDLEAMIDAGKAANKKGIPVVLDPVGVGATTFRKEAIRQILEEITPTVIKGNAGEMAQLVDIPWEIKGVDSVGSGNSDEIARKVAEKYKTIAFVTGATDYISNGKELVYNQTGSAILSSVTGTGCLLGSILTACLTANHSAIDSTLAAASFYGMAAEYTEKQNGVKGTGTFIPVFLDALSFSPEQLEGGEG
ncbi:hydroxyethylthiazole kinase [Jeotgalibacillus campisalis]|uniref:Hydroxyethylthiazole kinase n=1 Tax=Jeotgalibacillus campisalis TaxID=220754 RepID=A0A0C2WAF0_9BACL|nr:hydroxyethylthiazole kinase [Jeotgalibacillus campisalis]KIL53003.1 hydroxyethylthiazole kinase [Jeotgalibacillus campisalis]